MFSPFQRRDVVDTRRQNPQQYTQQRPTLNVWTVLKLAVYSLWWVVGLFVVMSVLINHAAAPLQTWLSSPSASTLSALNNDGDSTTSAPSSNAAAATAAKLSSSPTAVVNDQFLMQQSMDINETTIALRANLNSPTPNRLSILGYPALNQALDGYQKSIVSFRDNQPWLFWPLALVVLALVFLILPVSLSIHRQHAKVNGLPPKHVHPATALALLAVITLMVITPLQAMSLTHTLSVATVRSAFLGSSFNDLQQRSQRELIDAPAAESILGPAGRTDTGITYVTAVRNGDPVTAQQVKAFAHEKATNQTAIAVPASSLIHTEVVNILERVTLLAAQLVQAVLTLLMSPLVALMIMLLAFWRKNRKYALGYVGSVIVLFIALGVFTLVGSGIGWFDLWFNSTMAGSDLGFTAAVLTMLAWFAAFHLLRWMALQAHVRARTAVLERRQAKSMVDHDASSQRQVLGKSQVKRLAGRASARKGPS